MGRMNRSLLLSWVLLAACGASPPVGSDAGASDGGPGGHADAAGPIEGDAGPGLAPDAGPVLGDERFPLQARFPEGGAYDPVGGAFYVGSLEDGSVHRVDRATGAETVLFTERMPGTWWTLGMHVDAPRRRLFVCAMDDMRGVSAEDPPFVGRVWEFDLERGERVANHDLSQAQPRATCTDVTTTRDGTLFVSDREHPNVYRIADGVVELFATDEALSSSVVGLNAIVPTPDETALLGVVYLPSRLVRIDLATREVEVVGIDGSFSDGSPALSGADGMAFASDGRLLVAFTSAVTTLEPVTSDWRAARARSVNVPEGMTDVVLAEGAPYLLNGQSVRFAFGREPDPFALVRFLGR